MPTVTVVDRGGVSTGLPSRADRDPRLRGTKHQVAAEHHGALARMYAERIAWLEDEISHALHPLARPPQARTEAPPLDDPRAGSEPALYPVPSTRAPRPAA